MAGGLVELTTPMICGGTIPCYKLVGGSWTPVFPMVEGRYHLMVMPTNSSPSWPYTFLVFGKFVHATTLKISFFVALSFRPNPSM
jgi:hypothetical protein